MLTKYQMGVKFKGKGITTQEFESGLADADYLIEGIVTSRKFPGFYRSNRIDLLAKKRAVRCQI
jgi:hypothetical protein